jgi:hypothetical protein
MLSLFPQLLSFAFFSPLIIRLALALAIAFCGWKHLTHNEMRLRAIGIVELALAAALAVGAWTQADALIAFAIGLVWLAFPSTRILPKSTIFLCLVLSVSLLITGAGAYAFDWPL